MDFETILLEKYNFSMKPQQRESVLAVDGPAMLLAVPGSGKTTTIALRCANMILCCGVAPESILTVSYSHSCACDLKSRYLSIFGETVPAGLRFATIYSFCSLVLREYSILTQSGPPKLIEGIKRRLIRSLYAQQNDGEYISDQRLDELIIALGFVKNRMQTGDQLELGYNSIRNFNRINVAYQAYMDANCCMDLDEMQRKALQALEQSPDLLEKFRKQYRYINVDEAQEMSKLQHAIIKLLAEPHNNLFITGDMDQCLYSSKIASPEYLSDFTRVYPKAGVYTMERNYRSTHAIVDVACRLIRHNNHRGMVAMNTGSEIGMPVEETRIADNSMLGNHIVSQLESDPDFNDSAVLYRDGTSAIEILDALDREGIPCSLREQKLPFFNSWVVQDILAYMALGNDPADCKALAQIYRKLNVTISKESYNHAAALIEKGLSADALEALANSPEISAKASLIVKKLRENIVNLPGMSPGSAVTYILEKLKYSEYLKKADNEGAHQENPMQIADSLCMIATRTSSYAELLERIAKLSSIVEIARKNPEEKAVTLSTVHAVKGMEFKNIFIVDLCEGRFPSLKAITEYNEGKKEYMEEERRLLYVAITRASKRVELVYTNRINGERVKPSRFIREMLPVTQSRNNGYGRTSRKPMEKKKEPVSVERRSLEQKRGIIISGLPKKSAFEHFSLETGTAVEHRAFGQGIISSYDSNGDIVSVDFEKCGIKQFAASFCVEAGVIRKYACNSDESAG